METLYILIPLSVLAVGVAVGVFFWMNNDGQFDDDQGPAWSILLDDDRVATRTGKTQSEQGPADSAAMDKREGSKPTAGEQKEGEQKESEQKESKPDQSSAPPM